MITPAVPAWVSRSSTAAPQLQFVGTIASAVLTSPRNAIVLPATSIALLGSTFWPAVGTGPAAPLAGEAEGAFDEFALVDRDPRLLLLDEPGGPDERWLVK